MARAGKISKALAPLAALGILAACSGAPTNVPLEGVTASEIYQRGEFELSRGRAKSAAHFFSEIERLYPYSEWAKRALVMEAYSYHQKRDYPNSRAAAQRYLEFYPADEDAAYAQYLLALSYYDQIDDVGRDQKLTFDALKELRKVIENYPDSDYARSAVLKFDLAFDHLAAKEMEVGRYYLKRGNYTAAANRFRTVVEKFQTTNQTPEALYRLIEVYLALGLNDEAQTAGAILGHNFRSSPFYQDGFDLLKGKGLSPDARAGGWLAQVWRQVVRGEWL